MDKASSRRARAEPKSERLELRVTHSAKRVIQRASAVSGLSAADLAYEGARLILDQHERVVLSEADRQVFLRALRNPPRPTARLLSALKRHAVRIG